MGKSRSAACVMAYLMHKFHISPSEALAQLRESRPLCEPNGGFMEQLELYHRMSATDDIETDPVYNRWLFSREVEQSRQCGQAPDSDKIRFEDEHASGDGAAKQFSLKCRKCRRSLATSQFVLFHGGKKGSEAENTVDSSPSCAHYFVDPLSWMRPELEQGRLDGRLECPKCKTNVGKYAWQGMQCSCGDWVVPGISLARGRVDETRSAGGEEAMGIRRPPGIERSQGHL
ncbi:MAG: hypothetical protein M1820_000360 [Bogoriella megaspora]|nr:MAG: hypothetical protein M1820_000360 [Bogoriella megaspora]